MPWIWSRSQAHATPAMGQSPTYCRCRSISVVLLPPTQFRASRGFGMLCKKKGKLQPEGLSPGLESLGESPPWWGAHLSLSLVWKYFVKSTLGLGVWRVQGMFV